MIAAQHVRSYCDRILRLKTEQDDLSSDIRDIYAEAKGNGFDKQALGRLVTYLRKREKDGAAVAESDAMFDLYLAAYDGDQEQPSRAHTHARAREVSSDPAKSTPASPKALDVVAGVANAGDGDEVADDRTVARTEAYGNVDFGTPSGADAGRRVEAAPPHSKPLDAGDPPAFLDRRKQRVAA